MTTPLLIFLLRIGDVSLGTIRTIFVNRGYTYYAAVIGFLEVSVWIYATVNLLSYLNNSLNILAYCSGYALGIIIGSLVEKKIAIGTIVVNIFSSSSSQTLTDSIRQAGFGATLFTGWGQSAPIQVIQVMAPRKKQQELLRLIDAVDPEAFITIGDTRHAIRGYTPYAPSVFSKIPADTPAGASPISAANSPTAVNPVTAPNPLTAANPPNAVTPADAADSITAVHPTTAVNPATAASPAAVTGSLSAVHSAIETDTTPANTQSTT
jgi:uncharacterized protein YebE (UPF0316 family)